MIVEEAENAIKVKSAHKERKEQDIARHAAAVEGSRKEG